VRNRRRAHAVDAVREPAIACHPRSSAIAGPHRPPCQARRTARPGCLATNLNGHRIFGSALHPPLGGGRRCQRARAAIRQAHAGPRATSAAALCYPPSTSRQHVPVTAPGHRCLLRPWPRIYRSRAGLGHRRSRRGLVSAADVGAPRAAQPERSRPRRSSWHERRLRSRIQRCSREAMLLPEGGCIAACISAWSSAGFSLPRSRPFTTDCPCRLVAGKCRRVCRWRCPRRVIFTRRRHAAQRSGPGCALPSPSSPAPAHHGAALRRAVSWLRGSSPNAPSCEDTGQFNPGSRVA